jgi:hypothetical protein
MLHAVNGHITHPTCALQVNQQLDDSDDEFDDDPELEKIR